MFEKDSRGWYLLIPTAVLGGVYAHVYNVIRDPELICGRLLPTWDAKTILYATAFIAASTVWQINVGIVLRKKRDNAWELRDETKPEPKPEPKPLPEGLKPIIRVNGMPRLAFAVKAPKLDREREMYVILWRWHETGRQINLTEEYWVKQKKYFKRKEFAQDVKGRAEANGIFYRVNANKNAPHDVMDWQKVEKIARGGVLPH